MAFSYRKEETSLEMDKTTDFIKPAGQFVNPLSESGSVQTPDPCILVIFGASGDLTKRKLMPALFNLMKDGCLPTNFVCTGFARKEKNHEEFRSEIRADIQKFSRTKAEDAQLQMFTEKLFYFIGDFDREEGYEHLKAYLASLDKQYGTHGNRVFYLSVQPIYFRTIIEKLRKHGLIYEADNKKMFSRVIIEKPFGHDYNSALTLQNDITQYLNESQIYRIDHYLGKETVQNLLVFRFSNAIFENLWNNKYIDNIQITVAESIGIEGRGAFWEEEGLVRDIMQNHVMQLLSLVTMEPPANLTPQAIHDEKVKVLQSIQPFTQEDIEKWCIRGQYNQGFIYGEPVVAYRKEERVNPNSNIETFASFCLFIENWRLAGVPIFIRAGKRLPKKTTEIVVTFKTTPKILFYKNDKQSEPNRLIFKIQPDEGIAFKFNSKIPGSSQNIQPVNMNFQYSEYFGKEVPEAYERLISDAMLGDTTLFARVDESIYSWKLFTPILDYWKNKPLAENEFYESGTWGPPRTDELTKRFDRMWKAL